SLSPASWAANVHRRLNRRVGRAMSLGRLPAVLNPAKKFPEFSGYAVFLNDQLAQNEDSLAFRLRAQWEAFTDRQKEAYQERVPEGPVVRVRPDAKRQRCG
ncbi:unnamed protein product, partial [Effrenium voratum]